MFLFYTGERLRFKSLRQYDKCLRDLYFADIDWNYFMALFIVFTRKARNGAFSIFINVRQRYPFYLYCQNFTAKKLTLDAKNKYF